jgi:two-component system, OmpR family, sensor histidine kinase CiaH
MTGSQKRKLATVTVVYWFLLSYMVAALIWWFIALEKQNQLITSIRLTELKKDDPSYLNKVAFIENASKRKTFQYIGEGSTFLVLILIGAVFVFRATRRQIRGAQQQQNFMMAVTHELKTPIAVAQLNLETLQKRQLDEDKRQKLISNTLQEANRLNTLCNNILFAAQLDAGVHTQNKQEIHLSDLVEGCIDNFKTRYPQRIIEEAIQASVFLQGESLLLQMLVNNLIENALKYSPKDQPIKVSLIASADSIQCAVADLGKGVEDAEKQRIFNKFYRIGNENTRKAKGTGLGLYLCKKIADGHNAYISVTDNQPQGCIFTVSFKNI